MIHAISFGSNVEYEMLSMRILQEFKARHELLSHIACRVYGVLDLPQWVHDLPDTARGYKNCIWKPVIALHALAEMLENEVLYYTDGRSRIDAPMPWFLDFLESGADVGALQMTFVEQEWTRADVMAAMDVSVNSQHALSGQILSGTWAVRNTPATRLFLSKWCDFMQTHYEMCLSGLSTLPNAPLFKDNRHDQSVWSLLCKTCSSIPVSVRITPADTAYKTWIPHVYAHPV
jgi:hypothetical protein